MKNEPEIRLTTAIYALILVVVAGISGLMLLEHWSVLDASWVTIVSLTTTGFGDLVPQTVYGRVFLMVLITVGMGVVAYSVGAVISVFLDAQIKGFLEKSGMKEAIRKLNHHIIVCGAGRVGRNVVEILSQDNVPYILIDDNEDVIAALHAEGIMALCGDATMDEVLHEAGIDRARGVISALSEDAYNVFVVLTAKALNPKLTVVARAERPETIEKLKRAGADKVIAPALLGGQRMATAILKPVSVDLVDTLFTAKNIEVQIEEIEIRPDSQLENRDIQSAIRRNETNCIVVAILRNEEVFMNPTPREVLRAGDVLVVLGSRRDLEMLEKMAIT
ncbi:MAG: potassium channel family protein [Solirubrobacterales bacterium]